MLGFSLLQTEKRNWKEVRCFVPLPRKPAPAAAAPAAGLFYWCIIIDLNSVNIHRVTGFALS